MKPRPTPFPREMLESELDYLRSILSDETRANVYEEILILYSNYMAEDGAAKEKLSEDIEAVINNTKPPEEE